MKGTVLIKKLYKRGRINVFSTLPNDVHLVESFPFFKNKVFKFLFDKEVARTMY